MLLLSRVRLFATPRDCSTPGLPVHHQFPEFTQSHVHRVSDPGLPSLAVAWPPRLSAGRRESGSQGPWLGEARGPSGLRWVWRNGRGPHLEARWPLELLRGVSGPSSSCVWNPRAPGEPRPHTRFQERLSDLAAAARSNMRTIHTSPSAGDLRELPRVPLRGEGSCGGGGAPRDSAGSGATDQGRTGESGAFGMWPHPRGSFHCLAQPGALGP